jgi:tripartite-type tricarboxylate transporter receptor subunit TctC
MRAAFASSGLLLGLGWVGRAGAQSTVDTLRILCVSGAGGGPDLVARRVAEQLTGSFAKNTIVDNRPGAGGRIAVNALKLAPTDGATWLLAGVGVSAINPLLSAKLGYDPAIDLQPMSLVAEMPMALAVGPAMPDGVVTVRQLIDWMRANPKLANIGSPGIGSMPHLLAVALLQNSDVPWQHVAFSGGPPALNAVMGGQVAALVLPVGVLRTPWAAGKLRVLATSGAQRSSLMPSVATLVEQGHAGLVVQEWFAFFMHGGAATAQVDAASQAVRAALLQPALVAAFAEWGIIAASSTPAVLSARIATERQHWGPIIQAAGIQVE